MKEQRFPPGWDEKRIKELIAHYENQTEDEEFADIDAARQAEDITLMAIPTELVPEVRALRARKESAWALKDLQTPCKTQMPPETSGCIVSSVEIEAGDHVKTRPS